jgi:hypothetical protein
VSRWVAALLVQELMSLNVVILGDQCQHAEARMMRRLRIGFEELKPYSSSPQSACAYKNIYTYA